MPPVMKSVLAVILIVMTVGIANAATLELRINASHDGYIFEGTPDAIFPVLRNGVGDSVTNSPTDYLYAGYTLGTTTNGTFNYHSRAGVTVPTYLLNDYAIPTGANLTFFMNNRYNSAGTPSLELIDFYPDSNATYVATDYSKTTFTKMATNFTYLSLTLDAPYANNFTLTNVTTIDVTGNTSFMFDHSDSVYNINMSNTWTSTTNPTGFRAYPSNHATGNKTYYLTVTYTLDPPASSFTPDYTGGISPLLVNFTDTSTNAPIAWLWYDGDVLFNSTQNPQFVPFTTGNHQIVLNASNEAGGTNSSVTWINVTDAPALVLPVPDFNANVTTVTWPTAVQFTDLSESNILGRNWTFGDGTNSTAANPSHTYPNTDATYTVILEVVNISGYNTTTKVDYVTVTALDPPVASFTKNATIGVQPATIQFTDTSTNTPTQWNWSFGDGTWDNSTQNATHTYTSAGVFNAFLIATNAAGSNQSANQTVTIYDSVTADFTATASGTTVTFTDTSAGTRTAWVWQYNNPATPGWTQFSTEANPAYTFTPGTYDISLNASNPVSFDSEVKTGYIVVTASGAMLTENPQNLQPQQAGSYIIIALTLVGLGFIIGGAVMIVKMLTKGTGMMNGRGGSATPDLSGDFVIGLTAITIGAIFLLVTYVILSPMFTISGV